MSNIVPDSTYEALNRGVPKLKRLGQTMNDDNADTAHVHASETKTTAGGEGAGLVLTKASQIRQAIYLIKAQRKEIQKAAKEKINTLERTLAALIDDYDCDQMELFDLSAVISPDCQEVLDDPSL